MPVLEPRDLRMLTIMYKQISQESGVSGVSIIRSINNNYYDFDFEGSNALALCSEK